MFNSFKKNIIRVVTVFLLITLMTTLCLPVSAKEVYPTEAYDTYTYWSGPGGNQAVNTTPLYQYKTVIDGDSLGIGAFLEPQDVYTDKQGNIYIADTGNGRVVVVTPDYKLKTVLSNLTYQGQNLNIEGLQGVFVHDNGDIYICDTKNARIIICDINGTVKRLLTLPDADVIPDSFIYAPTRVVIDSKGITYVISNGSYFGAVMYNSKGEFAGFFGANSVEGSFLTFFTKVFDLIFRNDQKKQNQAQNLPYQFNDIAMDDKDFVYTATGAVNTYTTSTGQIKKLSPSGSSILTNKTRKNVSSSSSFDFADGAAVKYTNSSGLYSTRVTDLRSLDVDQYGYIYGLCTVYGHVFIYDQDCNLLSVFGGGMSEGYQKGTFGSPQSIRFDRKTNDVIIVDKLTGNVTVYEDTAYGALLKQAQQLTYSGAYLESKPVWEQVIAMDRGCQLAYRGLAKAALIEGDNEKAMAYAKNGFDQDTYANAFTYVRNDYLTKNFTLIFLGAIALIGGLIFFFVYAKKKNIVLIKNEKLKVMFSCIVHPFEATKQIRYNNQGSLLLAVIALFLLFVSTVASDIYSGFMHVLFNKSTNNSIFTLISTAGLISLFAICNWAMSTLFEGKGTVKQVFIVTAYAFIPQIFYMLFFAIFSNVLTPDEALILNVVSVVCLGLTLIILSVGLMTVHEFGLFKLIGMLIITLIAMLVVVFVIFMVGILITQMVSFIETLIQELRYR